MAKSTYSIVVIREGRERDYRDFWIKNKEENSSGEELTSDLVGFTESVEARNKKEAESIVKAKYPNLSLDTEATHRLG